MQSQEPAGVGLVYTNGNGNVAVCNLLFENPAQAKAWAKKNLEETGAGPVRTTKTEVTAGELTWTLIEMYVVDRAYTGLPSQDHYQSFR